MQTQMNPNQLADEPWNLSSLDWRVWFLGYGVGGCAGLTLVAGVWSLLVDPSVVPGFLAMTIAAIHSGYLFLCWARRAQVRAKPAIRNCFLLGSAGIATVAVLLNAYHSQVPSASTLYSLSFMAFVLAFVMPLQAESPFDGTKRSSQVSGSSPS